MKPTPTQNKIFSRIKKNTDEITNLYDLHRHRMTYEWAGEYFRAMKLDLSILADLHFGMLFDICKMKLILPDIDTFSEFLRVNADRLQLFDTPKKLEYTVRCGYHGWSYIKELS
jgi:hypothetical protein